MTSQAAQYCLADRRLESPGLGPLWPTRKYYWTPGPLQVQQAVHNHMRLELWKSKILMLCLLYTNQVKTSQHWIIRFVNHPCYMTSISYHASSELSSIKETERTCSCNLWFAFQCCHFYALIAGFPVVNPPWLPATDPGHLFPLTSWGDCRQAYFIWLLRDLFCLGCLTSKADGMTAARQAYTTRFPNQLHIRRAHRCGYCMLEYLWRYSVATMTEASAHAIAAEYLQNILKGTPTIRSHSHSGTALYETYITGQEESGCVLSCGSSILSPGGVLELFFDGVCGPRSETPTHI